MVAQHFEGWINDKTSKKLKKAARKTDLVVTQGAMSLRNHAINGSYRPADLKADLPIEVSITQLAGEKAIKQGDISEELRILYVALTRAKEHLIFVCSTTSKASKTRIARSLYMNDENNNKYLHLHRDQ